jgi:hypothetical protein
MRRGNRRAGAPTPARSTLDWLQGRRSSKVLVARNRLQRSTFRPLARSARATIVQSLSEDTDALMDCTHEKGLQMQAFSKGLKGFEPSTFCMASRSLDSVHALNVPANRAVSTARAGAADVRFLTRNHGSFRTETGLASIRSAAVHGTSARRSAGAADGPRAQSRMTRPGKNGLMGKQPFARNWAGLLVVLRSACELGVRDTALVPRQRPSARPSDATTRADPLASEHLGEGEVPDRS